MNLGAPIQPILHSNNHEVVLIQLFMPELLQALCAQGMLEERRSNLETYLRALSGFEDTWERAAVTQVICAAQEPSLPCADKVRRLECPRDELTTRFIRTQLKGQRIALAWMLRMRIW